MEINLLSLWKNGRRAWREARAVRTTRRLAKRFGQPVGKALKKLWRQKKGAKNE